MSLDVTAEVPTDGLRARVEKVVDVIRPAIQADEGDIVLHDVDEATGEVVVELVGACVTCPASDQTLKAGIERILKDRVDGVTSVRNVGEGLVELIVAERDENGPFVDFYDFCERCDTSVLNKRTVESLVKAGAFDAMGHPRQGLLHAHEQIIDHTVARRKEHDMGVMSLFGESSEGPGLYVSDHPLNGYETALRRRCDASISELEDVEDGLLRIVGGVVTNLDKKWTRRGDLMAVFALEDLVGSMEVMVFPKTMAEHGHKLADDVIVLVKGRIDRREDLPKLICQEVEVLRATELDEARPIRVKLPVERVRPETIDELKGLLAAHPGDSEVFLHLGDRQVLRLPEDYSVDPASGLVAEIRVLLGADSVLAI